MFFVHVFVAQGSCDPTVGLGCAPQLALDSVEEASDYHVILDIDLPVNANWAGASSPTYAVDASDCDALPDRVAYYLELDGAYAWVSMDEFGATSLAQLRIPDSQTNNTSWQTYVSNMNVRSNTFTLLEGDGIATGNLEIWHNCYNQANAAAIPGASGTAFDWGDSRSVGSPSCYGSFQVHNWGIGQTIFAYNGFMHSNVDDVGIGNRVGTTYTDWTYAATAATHVNRRLVVLGRFEPGACDDTPFDLPAAVVDMTGIANTAYVGSNPVHGSAATRLRPATLQGQLQTLLDAVHGAGCTVQGTSYLAGAYDSGPAGALAGAWEYGALVGGSVHGPTATFQATLEDSAHFGTFSAYNSAGQVVASRADGGFVAGRWSRVAGTRGVFMALTGVCDGASPADALGAWYQGSLSGWP